MLISLGSVTAATKGSYNARVRLGTILLGIFVCLPLCRGQVAVTDIDHSTVNDLTNVSVGNISYLNRIRTIPTVRTATTEYAVDGLIAPNVYYRRGATGVNGATVWFQTVDFTGPDYAVQGEGDSTPTLQEMADTRNIAQGLENPFANTVDSSTYGQTSNIERIDVYFGDSGYVVTEGAAFVLFDLEAYGSHGDAFRIAAFNGADTAASTNDPTSYVNTGLFINPGSFGDKLTVPGGSNVGYIRSETTNGNNIGGTQTVTVLESDVTGAAAAGDLIIVGIVIRFSDLGLNVGDTVYGYSVMAGDVVASTSSDLLDWTDTSVYLNTTNAGSDPNTDFGNIDFASFGGQIARPVPESRVYGLAFLATLGAAFAFRRRRQSLCGAAGPDGVVGTPGTFYVVASGLSRANFPLAAGAMKRLRNAATRLPIPKVTARADSKPVGAAWSAT